MLGNNTRIIIASWTFALSRVKSIYYVYTNFAKITLQIMSFMWGSEVQCRNQRNNVRNNYNYNRDFRNICFITSTYTILRISYYRSHITHTQTLIPIILNINILNIIWDIQWHELHEWLYLLFKIVLVQSIATSNYVINLVTLVFLNFILSSNFESTTIH